MPLTRTQIVERAAEYARAVLGDEDQLRSIIGVAVGAAWDAQPSTGDSIRLGKRILVEGFCEVRRATDTPTAGRRSYTDVEEILGEEDEGERLKTIHDYAKLLVITMRMELKGTDAQRGRWDAELDTDVAYDAMSSDARTAQLRKLAQEECAVKQKLADAPVAAAGGGGGGGGGGGSSTIHTPKLPKMPTKEMTPARTYRHLKVMLGCADKDKTLGAMTDALEPDGELIDSWRLYSAEHEADVAFKSLPENKQVDRFLAHAMQRYQPELFASDDAKEAIGCKLELSSGVSLLDYFHLKHSLLLTAKLSGTAAGNLDAKIKAEDEWCKLAVEGLPPRLKTEVKKYLTFTSAGGGALPAGHARDHFTDWNIMEKMVCRLATAANLDMPRSTGKTDDKSDTSNRTQYSAATRRRLNALRAQHAAYAIEAGHTYRGCAMIAQMEVTDAEGHVTVPRCLDCAQALQEPLPPLLLLPGGGRAPPNMQLCRHAYWGKPCKRQAEGKCKFDHKAKEEFEKLLMEGKTNLRPLVPRSAQDTALSTSSSSTPSSLTLTQGESSLAHVLETFTKTMEQRMEALERSTKTQENLMMLMDERIREVSRAASPAEERANALRKVAQTRAAAKAAEEQLTALSSGIEQLTDTGAEMLMVGSTVSMDPGSEEYWGQKAVLEGALAMITKASAEPTKMTYASSHGPGAQGIGQPMSTLDLKSTSTGKDKRLLWDVISVIWDSACTPTGLMTLENFIELTRRNPECCTKAQFFAQPKAISGVGSDAVMVVASATVTAFSAGRPIILHVGLMTNGSTGNATILVGNYQLRHIYDAQLDFSASNQQITLKKPDDGGPPLSVPIKYTFGDPPEAKAAESGEERPGTVPVPWNLVTRKGVTWDDEATARNGGAQRGRGRGRVERRAGGSSSN